MPLRALTILGLVSCSLLAQTTWTSFADRRGHAMARTSTGGVVMFGGESVSSPGELLGDTAALSTNNQTWAGVGAGPDEPPPTMGHSMAGALPSGQQAYVMFGGITSTGPSSRTYRYNGNAWGDVTSGVSPLARSGHAMVTNTATNTMLMFGGFDGTVTLNDVWEFAPGTDTWIQQTVGAAPVGRFGCSLAFHPGNGGTDGRMYMFGGSPFRNDLWEFNPFTSTWTQLFPAVSPPGRRYAAMAYLAGSNTIVMFAGLGAGGVIFNDTWSYYRGANTWIQESPTLVPPARYEHAVSADNTGNNLVLLGGTNVLPGSGQGPVIDETWLWSSLVSNWIRQLPSPSARDGAAMAYDSQRNRHVVFGGRTVPGAVDLAETWELEGLNWRERTPSPAPPPRADAAIAYDEARGLTVLFGGWVGGTCATARGDTWEWNGVAWQQRFPAQSPPASGGVQAVFDSQRGLTRTLAGTVPGSPHTYLWSWDGLIWRPDSIIQPGGLVAAFDSVRQELVAVVEPYPNGTAATFLWNLQGWRRPASTGGPSPRFGSRMVWDAARQEVVLHGGYVGASVLGDTWTWNGTTWQQRAGAGGPAVAGHYLAYHAASQKVVLFGGTFNIATGPLNPGTWEWNGSTWQQQPPPVFPTPRLNGGSAYDPVRGRMVIVGGSDSAGTYLAETWEYDGTTWYNLTSGTHPSARVQMRASWDPNTAQIVAFGGLTSGGQTLGDTWKWNGTTWTALTPTTNPPSRYVHQVELVGSQPTLLGGIGSSGSYNDIWRWDGSTWSLIDSGQPHERSQYGAAYDRRRDRLVIFGGRVGCAGAALNETWEWDGDSWLQRFPINIPAVRYGCLMNFDEARARVVLFGGTDGTNTFNDTWEWDGINWLQRSPDAVPPASWSHDLTFDKVRKVSVAFGSFGTWDYGPTRPATLTLYGSGCPTSASVPASAPLALKPLPWSGAWMGEPCEVEFTNAPPGLGLFLWGLSYTQWGPFPLPVSLALLGLGPAACNLRNSADLIEVMPVGVTRHVSFPMPSSPSALGLPLYGQAAFFDLGQPGFPVVTSDGAEMVIGQK